MNRLFTLLTCIVIGIATLSAANVTVIMNTTSRTMTLVDKATGNAVETGEAGTNYTYTFEANSGKYLLTAYASDGTTINGTMEIDVTNEATQEFKVLTCTAYASNKNADGAAWNLGEDFTIDVKVNTKDGVTVTQTPGKSTTANRATFLALNGNSCIVTFTPNEEHAKEGYMPLYKGATLTYGASLYGAIPMGLDYRVTMPKGAGMSLGMKFVHFTPFTEVKPVSVTAEGDVTTYTYRLADAMMYFYRTWKPGQLTRAGYMTVSTDSLKCPKIDFTTEDYTAFAPSTINHDVTANKGYETGDIFVNINAAGYLPLQIGESYMAHAMRTWSLTDSSAGNNFVEPDFHYTVINLDGTPSTGVIEIDNANTCDNPWSRIKAVGKGTVIVLVTYDAIAAARYSAANGVTTRSEYMGGEYWGAIWPENTAAYVVSVGETASTAVPNMLINETYNTGALKVAGKYIDSEHDVLYFLDSEDGAKYTFTPSGVASIELAYPTIGERMATYKGFGTKGVTDNGDGSYTLLLKEGRNIVRLVDAAGNATYQVITAKSCSRTITNVTRPEATDFQPGDQVTIQYSGLHHPSNKLAGIYNMSAYVTYKGVPNGTSLILGSGQYTFGSAPKAQAVTITIPADTDVNATPEFVLDEGVIQVNGYGDPIGNHRYISYTNGRSANFTAVAHKTYFGYIPNVVIPITAATTGIASVEATAAREVTGYYNINGVRLSEPQTGVNIVTYSDGSTRKLIVR